MSTILSMKDFANVPNLRIHMDSDIEKAINVSYKGRLVNFKEYKDGLYFYTKNKGIVYKNSISVFLLFCPTNHP